jgi:type IV secretory pathway VirJ component
VSDIIVSTAGRARVLLTALCLGGLAMVPAQAQETLSHGRFTGVRLYRASGATGGVVLLLSGEGGWDDSMARVARELQDAGALVIGISTPSLLGALERSSDDCIFPDGDLENLSHFIQGYAKLPTYRTPLLMGNGSGAALAYAMLAQAPAGTFSGALTLNFCPELKLRKPLCQGEGVHFRRLPEGRGVELLPATSLSAPWVTLQGSDAPHCPASATHAFVSQISGAAQVTLRGPGLVLKDAQYWMPSLAVAYRMLGTEPGTALPPPPRSLDDLPLIEVPAAAGAPGSDVFAVLLSGDGGWAGLDTQVAAALAAKGVPVVGFDSLRYFWTPRTPEGLAIDVDRVLREYSARWGKRHALLVGYSQGADVLPFAVNRLPAASRARVVRTVLLGPGEKASFEFHLGNWVGADRGGLPLMPEVGRLEAANVLCLYGSDESGSLCPKIPAGHVTAGKLPGGHHFDGNYDALAERILANLPPIPH